MVAWKLMSTYTELGRRVDELEVDLLKIPTRSVNHERLADRDNTLLGTRDGTLQHEVVVLDDTVVGEATHGSNALLGDIMLSRGVGVVVAPANAVDLLVEFGTVMVTVCHNVKRRFGRKKITFTYFDPHERRST